MSLDLNHTSLLITGGTGSFGRKFIEIVLQRYPEIERIIVYSRDEQKQYEMMDIFPPHKYKALQFMIGDVRDAERLKRACEGVDYIIHAAALKQAPMAEHNPMEYIKTNIFGAENVINAALDGGVKKVIALSTDKAASPGNLYGATKLCADKLFVAANNMTGKRDLTFSVVRYGNVIGSRGSVVPYFLQKKKEGVLPITHPGMTRFNIAPEESIDMVLWVLKNAWGGEIYVPKLPSYHITDLATAICPECTQEIVGIRPGEKLHEEMITETDSLNTVELKKYFAILPFTAKWREEDFINALDGNKVEPGFVYNSSNNSRWLSVEDLKKQIELLNSMTEAKQ